MVAPVIHLAFARTCVTEWILEEDDWSSIY